MEVKLEGKLKLKSGMCIGVFDDDNYIVNYLKTINITKHNIVFNGKKLNQKELVDFKKKISVISSYPIKEYFFYSVYEYMKEIVMNKSLDLKDYRKKITDSLKIVGLQELYLTRQISSLSKSEGALLCFACGLLSNPDILVFDHYFNSLDMKYSKKILRLIGQLTEQYDKLIVFTTNKIEHLYTYSKYAIILKEEDVFLESNTDTLFEENIEKLLEDEMQLPKSIMFSYLVSKNKNVKLGLFKDIRDLIKDIYKKV